MIRRLSLEVQGKNNNIHVTQITINKEAMILFVLLYEIQNTGALYKWELWYHTTIDELIRRDAVV